MKKSILIALAFIIGLVYTLALYAQDTSEEPDVLKIISHTPNALLGYAVYLLYQIKHSLEENKRLLEDVRKFYESMRALIESEGKDYSK